MVRGRGVSMQRARRTGTPQQVTVDYVPEDEVEVHRELTVCATDSDIGQVGGLVVEPGGHHVTHVLLQEGHMWGRKEVAIPIGAVTKIGTLLIHLRLTKHQVKDLPPVDIDHPARVDLRGDTPYPRPTVTTLVRDDAESGARGLHIPGADTGRAQIRGWPAECPGVPLQRQGTRRSLETRCAEMIYRSHA